MIDPLSVVVVSLQGAIFLTLVEGVRRRDVAVAVNALASLSVALLPAALTVTHGLVVGPVLPLWVSVAGLLHSIGMLGPYDTVRWWDHVTHFVSSALAAALFYAVAVTSVRSAAVVTLLFTLAVGLLWELVELAARELGDWLDVDPMLVHYGWRDTALDLGFDVVGAVFVVVVDLRVLVPVVEQVLAPTRGLVLWSAGAVAAGSTGLSLLIAWFRLGR